MKNTLALLGLAILFTSSSGFAVSFLGVDLEPRFAYEDLDNYCTVDGPWLYISLTGSIVDGKLVNATLTSTDQTFALVADEYSQIEVQADALGQYHVTKLPLNARVLNWVFFHLDGWVGSCHPSQGLGTIAPYGFTYVFSQGDSTDYYSVTQRFKGTRADGTPYALKLGFTQALEQR